MAYQSNFISYFGRTLAIFLVRSVQTAFEVGERSITKKGGLLLVFLKVRNRGIFLKTGDLSLLYTDYTIITSVMASRMINYLKEIIGPDQKGFLKDGYIEENTRLAYD
jgi:hypothetical protein